MFMRKRFLFLLILVVSLVLMSSCKIIGGENKNNGDTDDIPSGEAGVIYSPDVDVTIIAEPSVDYSYVDAIITAITELTGRIPTLESVNTEKTEHLIIIGRVDRDLSDAAYQRIDRYHPDVPEEEYADYPRYLIYSASSSVVIAYEEDPYDLALDAAIQYFVKTYLKTSTLALQEGTHYRNYCDVMEHIKATDNERKEQQWADLHRAVMDKSASLGAEASQKLADDFIASMKNLYSIYTPDMVSWFANLYEPYFCVCEGECQKTENCGGGGFYYSNSGRNTVGYLPDTESTSQALGFISSSGMAVNYGGSYRKAIPTEMADQIAYYIKNSQAPNGFFYNAQWTQAETDAQLSRRARDLNWCTSMLSTFGLKPTYDTPNGVEGDGYRADGTPVSGEPSAGLTAPLGTSSVTAASKVVAVSNTPAHLRDEASFRAYLATLDIHNKSYPVGNTLTAQSSQIKQTPGLMEILIEWLNANQNPATGHWDWKVEGDEGYSDYYGVNGLLKISGIYNTAKVAMPHSAEAVQSAIDAITADETMGAVVDLYNTWFSISNILTNLINYSEDKAAGQAQADEIILNLLQQSPGAIKVSMEKIYAFQKLDGSFSYGRNASSSTSQGMPVAVPGTNEGDVNATVIASTGLLGNIYSALRLTSYTVRLFGEYERRQFVEIIENLQPVEKDSYETEIIPATFDNDAIGDEPSELDYKLGNSTLGSYVKVVDDSRTDKKDRNVLEFATVKGSGDYVYVPNNFSTAKAKCYVFEGEFCMVDSVSDYVLQVYMGSAYMFIFKVSGGKVNIWDASSASGNLSQDTELGLAPAIGEWFKLKVEYYVGTHDTVRIKFYYNDTLAAITDNYYNSSGTKITTGTGSPSKTFSQTSIYAMNGVGFTMQLDNLVCYCTAEPYVAPTTNLPPVNVDMPDSPEKIYDFTEGIHEDITVDTAEVVEKTVDGESKNMLAVAGTTRIPVTIRTKGTNCGVAMMNVYCDESVASGKVVGNIIFRDVSSSSAAILGWNLKVVTVGGVKYLTLVEAPDGSAKTTLDDVLIPLGELAELRIDYYHTEDIAIIYVNNNFVTASAPMYKSAAKYTFGKLDVVLPESGVQGLYIESVKAERVVSSFAEATKPEYDTEINDFEGDDASSMLSGGATIITVAGNKAASLDSSRETAVVKVPVLHRSKVMTTAVMDLALKVTSVSGDGELYRFAFTDDEGNIEFALVIVNNGGVLELREGSAGGTRSAILYRFAENVPIALRVEMYPEKKIANIYVADTCVAISSAFYNGAAGYASIDCLEITSLDTAATMTLDNVIAETLYKYYVKETLKASVDAGYNEDGVLDFAGGTTGQIPSSVTYSFNSSGAAIRIEKLMAAQGAWSDVLSFDTTSGGNDGVVFAPENSVTGKTCVAFEVDLCYTGSATGDMYQIMFCGEKGGGSIAYMYNLKFTGGTFWMVDCSSTGDNGNRYENKINFPENVAKGEWFTLRVEYYTGTKDTVRMKTYINGIHVYTSNNYYGHLIDGNDKAFNNAVNYVKFYSLGATAGTLCFDNVEFYGTNDKCTDDVTTN